MRTRKQYLMDHEDHRKLKILSSVENMSMSNVLTKVIDFYITQQQ
jgi:hypothetical protein